MSSLYSAGSNAHGQLSNGTQDDSHTFQRCTFAGFGDRLPGGSKFLAVAAGANHTLVHLQSPDGTFQLWGCGDNRRGQLGPNIAPLTTTFSRIHIDDVDARYGKGQIKLIEAAWETSFIVITFDDEDVLFSAGGNDFGDLGVGTARKEMPSWQLVPIRQILPEDTSEVRILGLRVGPHTIIVRLQYATGGIQDRLLTGWGACRHGQLGLKSSSTSQKLPNFIASPTIISAHGTFIDVGMGSQHSILLESNGTVLPFGSNRKGQIGGVESVRDVTAVQATWNGSYLLQKHSDDGDEWALLRSYRGNERSASSASTSAGVAGFQKVHFPTEASAREIVDFVCGSEHVLARLPLGDGSEVYGWGWNEHGNLGLGHTKDVEEPTRVWPANIGRIAGIWAGCATSWIAIERESSN